MLHSLLNFYTELLSHKMLVIYFESTFKICKWQIKFSFRKFVPKSEKLYEALIVRNVKFKIVVSHARRKSELSMLFMESFSIYVFSSYIRKVALLKKKKILLKSHMARYKLDSSPIDSHFRFIECC